MSFGYQVLGFGSGGPVGPEFMEATGGSESTDGDYKVHTFTGDGTFTVTAVGHEATYGKKVEYLIVASGAGGGNNHGGGGGGGGYRHNSAYDNTVSAQAYSITVGAFNGNHAKGGDSVFNSLTSTGGGFGGGDHEGGYSSGGPGGSGGGGACLPNPGSAKGPGNTPSTTPAQGYDGYVGGGSPSYISGGGGGAAEGGGPSPHPGSHGGDGSQNDISGTATYYSPGGGGHIHGATGQGGYGGGGNLNGGISDGGNSPTTRGAGAGGWQTQPCINGVAGTVVVRYKYQ